MSSVRQMPDDDPDAMLADEILNQVRGILGEHFDVGLIILSKESPEGITSYHSTEFGNKFALRGMVESYVSGELNADDLYEE
jgi:hypothetical protein